MAVYKLNSKKKKQKTNTKKVVGFSLIVAASLMFLFLTGIFEPFQTFLLGVFGVFGFPLSIALFVVGLALVNNRKYVMSIKYTISLALVVFFALCILQLAVVGNKNGLGFGDYLAKNYLQKWTVGGILIGFFTTIFLYVANLVGAYIICALALVISVAVLLDSLHLLRKDERGGISLSLRRNKEENAFGDSRANVAGGNSGAGGRERGAAETASDGLQGGQGGRGVQNGNGSFSTYSAQSGQLNSNANAVQGGQTSSNGQNVNVVLDGNLREDAQKEQQRLEQQKVQKPLTAKQILGLDHKRNSAFEYTNSSSSASGRGESVGAMGGAYGTSRNSYSSASSASSAGSYSTEQTEKQILEDRKKFILTPPKIDLDEYFKDIRTTAPSKEEANKALDEMKTEQISSANSLAGDVSAAQNSSAQNSATIGANEAVLERADEGQDSATSSGSEFAEKSFNSQLQANSQFGQSSFNTNRAAQGEQAEFSSQRAEGLREDEFDSSRKLPDVQAEELVERADDILRSAIMEEKAENPEFYENVQAQELGEISDPLDNLPERDNSGNLQTFSRNFDRESTADARGDFDGETDGGRFERSDRKIRSDFGGTHEKSGQDRASFERARSGFENSIRQREEKNMNQEDLDARNTFRRQSEQMNMRNGTYARENAPIPKEEEEKPREPYVYEKPPVDFITTQSVDLSTLSEDVAKKRVLLENTLETFGVPAKVQGVVVGPAVTRYELEMPQGISVQKIKNRADDIALSLAAEGTIRIEAPIPGKSMVGIEVPNSTIATISLKDVIGSREFQEAKSPLTFALGKDITGKVICADMRKLTHLLVAGSTGSGKSVCLNSIILSIIYKASPEDVKLVLIDPKRVEFASYEALPHLIMPEIVCDTQKAINTLAWAVNEMERRFEALGAARVREISEYNSSADVLSGKLQKMPYIVIIVDELADLMMTGKKEVEDKICRLAQKARAAGIHLILATQRPSVDVITGLIKSNFPSRISFAVSSAVDSMTILDRVGAEKLLGKGDMFYFPNGAKDPSRMQGCFITTSEINLIVDYVRDCNMPIFDPQIAQEINNPNKGGSGNGGNGRNNDMDELLPQALKVSIECGQASATMIRRKFAIGYPRAARIIDQMEEAGYISSADGPKGRSVFISMEEYEQIFGEE